MKEIITKKIEVIKDLLTFKTVEEKIDVPKKRQQLTPKERRHRRGCRCGH
jgi:hypothetical protein